MKIEDCYQLGEVIKTHGLKGDVTISLDVDNPSEYSELESVFVLQEQTLVPFFIDEIHIQGKKARISFEEINSIEDASALVKCDLYLPLNILPELDKGQYYFHDLVGCQVFDRENLIGKVLNVIDLNGNNMISVSHKKKEALIPINDEIILEVDIKKKSIKAELPDGLLDLYL